MGIITVATSIAPRNIELQQSAISSWKTLGFNVVSVNLSSEVTVLSPLFSSVQFIAVDRSAEDYTGTPYVFFDDIIGALADCGTEVCGVINSDIHLRSTDELPGFVSKMARQALLFGSRVDVGSLDDLDKEVYFQGFDYFFFGQDLISKYPASKFCLGAPWWDYWAPSSLLVQDVPCYELVTPIAFHQLHDTKWSPDLFRRFGGLFIDEMKALIRGKKITNELGKAVESVKSEADYSRLSFAILQYIWKNSEQVSYPPLSDNDTSALVVGKQQLNGLRDQLGNALDQIELMHANLRELSDLVAELRKQEATLRGAISWRITAPLRKLRDMLDATKK